MSTPDMAIVVDAVDEVWHHRTDQAPLSELGKVACDFAANYGYRVHPCKGKIPILPRWQIEATTSLDAVEANWTRYPNASIGIATGADSGIVVLDIDDRETFDRWRAEEGVELPETAVAMTPRGGEHRYFRHPGGEVRNTTSWPPGCDIRGDGGNIIAPVGEGRGWAPGMSPVDIELAPLPSELLRERSQAAPAPPLADRVLEGERNATLASIAGSMRRRGASEAAIRAALIEENRTRCAPPLPASEVARIAASIAKYPPTLDYHLTDVGNGHRFAEHHRGAVRYCAPRCCWYLWDGTRWAEDRTGAILELAKATARTIYQEAAAEPDADRRKAVAKWAASSETRTKTEAMLYMARSEPGIPVLPEELDRDPYLFGVANGTINLRTGHLMESIPDNLITKASPVSYRKDATAPAWHAFLERVLPDPDVRWFVQKAAGYSMTGDVGEQVLFFLHGNGANGKSTALDILLHVLGDYGRQSAPDLLMFKYGNEHPTALADLQGRRLVTTIETQEGRRLAEVMVKQLTGGDSITARKMREDFFSFRPTHKLWLAANHKPDIRGTDYAIWRRIRLVPFTVQIPEHEQDRNLADRLKAEDPGILNWILEGCLAWQREGLKPPAAVRAAVDEYREEMDQVGQFIADKCNLDRRATTKATVLRRAYEAWCEDNGERPVSAKALSLRLQERSIKKVHTRGGKTYDGISLRDGGGDV